MSNIIHRLGDALDALRGKDRASMRTESKQDPVGVVTNSRRLSQKQRMPLDYEGYAKEGMGKCVVMKRAAEIVGHAVASVPLVYQKKVEGKWVDDETGEDQPIMQLLSRPNPQTSYEEFIEAFCGYDHLAGNAYIVGNNVKAYGDTSAPPEELWFLRPDRITGLPSRLGGLATYIYTVDSVEKRFEVDVVNGKSPVFHWKRFNPLNDYFGMSPMKCAALQIDQFNAGSEWNMNVLQNSGRPAGAFKYAPEGQVGAVLGVTARADLENEVDNKILNPKNARRPLILDGGLDWVEMSQTAVDLDWLEGLRDSSRWIALCFGVPSMLLGIPGDNTYANYEQARLALYEDTAIPYLKRVLGGLNRWLTPAFADPRQNRIWYNVKEVPALSLRRKETWDTVNASTFLTTDEKRTALGYEPIGDEGGGDEILVPSTMVPLSQQSLAPGEDGSRLADPNAPPEPAADESGKPVVGKPKPKLPNGKKTIDGVDRYKAIDAIFEKIK